jgi:hypothetical protein
LNIITKKNVQYKTKIENKLHKHVNDVVESNEYIKNRFKNETIALNDYFIKKTILCCSIVCKGSISNIQDFLKEMYNYSCSEGKISNILNDFSTKARKFNKSVDLSKIKVGANDEIFQASKPILVGVEPISNYIYLMNLEKKRDGETWKSSLEKISENQGLVLEKSVNDEGTGLKKGILLAFDGKCLILSDVFHAKADFQKGLRSLEGRAYKKIDVEYNQEKLYNKSNKNEENYLNALIESEEAINKYDNCCILYGFFCENVRIGGYNYLERVENITCIVNELEKYKNENRYIKKVYNLMKKNKEGLLRFIEDFYFRAHIVSQNERISPDVFKLMWKQRMYTIDSKEYGDIEAQLYIIAHKDYGKARRLFAELIKNTIRASSIVENVNSRLRPYLTLRKSPNQNLLDLLQ